MSAFSDVAPLVGGIIEEPLHLPGSFLVLDSSGEILSSGLVGAGDGGVIVASP